MALDLVVEELDEEQHQGGNRQCNDEGDEHNHRLLGADLSADSGIVDELALVGRSCERDRVLLTLLQKHQVEPRLHFLLAANLGEHALLLGCLAHLAFVFVVLREDGATLDLQVAARLCEGAADGVLQVVELAGEWDDGGRALAGALQQQVATLHEGVVVVDERRGRLVGQTHAGGQRLVAVGGIVDVAAHLVEQSHLCSGLDHFLRVGVCVLHSLAGIELELHHAVVPLVGFKLSFGVAQLGVDLVQTAVDEVFGA